MSTYAQEQLIPVLEDAPGETTGPILFENESLDPLLSTLPKTLGLMKSQLTYTCFDVSKDYFAAGTNLGIVCMYSFQSQNMQFIQVSASVNISKCAFDKSTNSIYCPFVITIYFGMRNESNE